MGKPMRPMPIQPISSLCCAIPVSSLPQCTSAIMTAGRTLQQRLAGVRARATIIAWNRGSCCGTAPRCTILNLAVRNRARSHAMHEVVDAPVSPSEGTSSIRAGDERWRIAARNAFPFLVVGGLWELVAHVGGFPPRLFPPLEAVAAALYRLTVAGILPRHAGETILRLAAGFAVAAIVGVAIGIAMGR